MSTTDRFLRFCLVGAIAAIVDMAVVEAMIRVAGFDPYSARIASYLAAATTAWALNRRITFTDCDTGSPLAQWARYLGTNLAGALINYAVYALLVSGVVGWHVPAFVAVAIGSLAGLAINFAASSRFVFRRPRPQGVGMEPGGTQ